MHLNQRIGPLTLRTWGLVLNLVGNVLLLHGAVTFLTGGAGPLEMAVGGAVTAACLFILSAPTT